MAPCHERLILGATLMNTLASAACALLLIGSGVSAQTLDDLKKDGNGGSTDNILTYGMGYHQQRYSPLKQINKQTVKRLVPVWNLSLDNNWGEQAQPTVYNGVMYVTNAKATVAIDVATGKQIWKQTLDWPPETPRVVCCGVSNKGAAIYNGKVFRTTLDAHVIAYDSGALHRSGTFDNVAAGTQAANWPRDGMPGHLPGHIARRS